MPHDSFALAPVVPLRLNPLGPGQRADVSMPLNFSGQRAKTDPINQLQLAFKNNVQVFYGQTSIPLEPLFGEDGRLEPAAYMAFWQEVRGRKMAGDGVAKPLTVPLTVLGSSSRDALASTRPSTRPRSPGSTPAPSCRSPPSCRRATCL